MDDKKLAELRELTNKATTAPWKAEAGYDGYNWLVAVGGSVDGNSYYVTTDAVHASELVGDARTDAEFIAAARNAMPGLLDALAAATQRAEAAEADTNRWLLSCQLADAEAARLRAELSITARNCEAERLAVAATVLELSQANVELAALNADLTERVQAAEAALARAEDYAVYWRDAADEWQDAGSRIMSFAEWLAAQPPHAGEGVQP